MNFNKRNINLLLLLLITAMVYGQSPKSEMRATWLATVWGLDWPRQESGVPLITQTGNEAQIEKQKEALIEILDNLVAGNMNAVFFQVRSRCDAMYKSSYEPWSSDLVRERGMDPGYDPLEFAVQEAHARGIELHAWINPYRFESVAGQWSGKAGDYNATHPDWVLTYRDMAILNPALPEVRQRVTDIVEEIITNYDVDGIIFDDYFYVEGIGAEDREAQDEYKEANMTVGDWRRENINTMVRSVYTMIQEVKPHIRFGISPAGIYDASAAVTAEYGLSLPEGISGGYMYNKIYCDPLAWLSEGTVDYISPQIYWTTNSGRTDYNLLAPWWSEVATHFGKHFYSSQTLSSLTASVASSPEQIVLLNGEEVKMGAMSLVERVAAVEEPLIAKAAYGPQEIGLQIEKNRNSDKNGAPGSVFYSSRKYYTTSGFIDYLVNYHFTEKALVPGINWKKPATPESVNSIALTDNVLSWNSATNNVRYSIYAIPAAQIADPAVFRSSEYLLGTSYVNEFVIPENRIDSEYTYAVAVCDRFGNEYTPAIMGGEVSQPSVVQLTYPSEEMVVNRYDVFSFEWTRDDSVISYFLEISYDSEFAELVCSREVYTNVLTSEHIGMLDGDKTYYWRVKTKKAGADAGVSDVRSFHVFGLNSPEDKDYELSLTPVISWSDLGEYAVYTVEISSSVYFNENQIIYAETYHETSCTLPEGVLQSGVIYYIRVRGRLGESHYLSQQIKVQTEEVLPDVPVIISPSSGQTISGNTLRVVWQEDNRASSFRVELSKSESFPSRSTTPITVDAFNYEAIYNNLDEATYYLRVRAYSSSAETPYTEWSDVVSVHLNTTSIAENQLNKPCYILTDGARHTLMLELMYGANVTVSLYSLEGVKIEDILLNVRMEGQHSIDLNTQLLNQGSYLILVSIDGKKEILKFIVY